MLLVEGIHFINAQADKSKILLDRFDEAAHTYNSSELPYQPFQLFN